MEKYLVKIAFDCNDSDYVYGLTVVDKDEKKIIDRNLSKSVSFGSYDFGGNECALRDCISIKQITEEADHSGFDKKMLKEMIKIRAMDSTDRAEQFELRDAYLQALGLL